MKKKCFKHFGCWILLVLILYYLVTWFFCWDISRFWLRLRANKETRNAIKTVENNGFYLSTHTPVMPELFELGVTKPRWYCRQDDRSKFTSLDEVRKAFKILNLSIFLWRNDKLFNDDDLKVIEGVESIELVDVHNTSVTDSSIQMLAEFPMLNSIYAYDTLMTEKALWLLEKYRSDNSVPLWIQLNHVTIKSEDMGRVLLLEKNNIHVDLHVLVNEGSR